MLQLNPHFDVPTSERGWIALLQKTLIDVLNDIGGAAAHFYRVIWPDLYQAWIRARDIIIAHREIALCITVLIFAVLLAQPVAKGIVAALGFTSNGVQAGSIAAAIQARSFGGAVPAGSVFSILQSFGAAGVL